MQKNPFVKLLAIAGNISVRIKGKAVFDVPDNIGEEIYETNSVLMRLYRSYSDLIYFRLDISEFGLLWLNAATSYIWALWQQKINDVLCNL